METTYCTGLTLTQTNLRLLLYISTITFTQAQVESVSPGWIGPIIAKGFCGLLLATKGIFMENIMLQKVANQSARSAQKKLGTVCKLAQGILPFSSF